MIFRRKRNSAWIGVAAALLVTCFTSLAWADEGLLVLVTEETVDETATEQAFWWESGVAPAWSPTDIALRDALRASGAGFAEPTDVASLSKIYRRPNPSDTNATAMATVFGRSKVLVGTVKYHATALRPLGLVGWTADVSVRLVERGPSGPQILRTVTVDRSRWASSDEEARASLRADVATAIAGAVSSGLRRQVAPVGEDLEELMIGVVAPSTRAEIDAVRAKLKTLAGVTQVQERWAAEGIIVLEINPGVADPRQSVQQYFTLLTTEGAGRWKATPVESRWPNVVAVRLEEQAQ